MNGGDQLQRLVGLRVQIDVPRGVQVLVEESATKECLHIFVVAPAADLVDLHSTFPTVRAHVVVEGHDRTVRASFEEYDLEKLLIEQRTQRVEVGALLDPRVGVGVGVRSVVVPAVLT
eukprot:9901847-Heterocapsa_arctica.AAC.1